MIVDALLAQPADVHDAVVAEPATDEIRVDQIPVFAQAGRHTIIADLPSDLSAESDPNLADWERAILDGPTSDITENTVARQRYEKFVDSVAAEAAKRRYAAASR